MRTDRFICTPFVRAFTVVDRFSRTKLQRKRSNACAHKHATIEGHEGVDSHLLTLLKKSTQFVVPIYQRVYSWQESECAQLWSDILRAGSNDKLGGTSLGHRLRRQDQGTNTSAEPDLIIDGHNASRRHAPARCLAERLDQLPTTNANQSTGFPQRRFAIVICSTTREGDGIQAHFVPDGQGRTHSIVQGATSGCFNPMVDNFGFFRNRLADPSLDLVVVCGASTNSSSSMSPERNVDNPQLVFEAMNSTAESSQATSSELV